MSRSDELREKIERHRAARETAERIFRRNGASPRAIRAEMGPREIVIDSISRVFMARTRRSASVRKCSRKHRAKKH